jgi:hypothetical protein
MGDLWSWQARLWHAQSAFTIGDLMDVARAEDPDARLEHMYEWYFARTMTAIRVAYGAAAAMAAALYGLALNGESERILSYGLTVSVIVCLMAGIVQRRELAQLHRELSSATGLLTELRALSRKDLADAAHARTDTTVDSHGWRSAGPALWWAVVTTIALLLITCTGDSTTTPERALVALAILVPLIAAPHALAEVRRTRRAEAEPEEKSDETEAAGTTPEHASSAPDHVDDVPPKAENPLTLLVGIMPVRLDDYVANLEQRKKVHGAIAPE